MKKILSYLLIFGMALGSYGIYNSSISFLSKTLGIFQDAKIFIMGETLKQNQAPTMPGNSSISPINKTYEIYGNDGTILYESDGINIIYELLKREIQWKKWNILGYNTVTPEFSQEDLKNSLANYYVYLYEFSKLPVYSETTIATPAYYYGITFRNEIENAFLKAFEGETIFIKTGALANSVLPDNICTFDGFLTEVNNPVFGFGEYRIRTVDRVSYSSGDINYIVVFSLFSLVPSQEKFNNMIPSQYPPHS